MNHFENLTVVLNWTYIKKLDSNTLKSQTLPISRKSAFVKYRTILSRRCIHLYDNDIGKSFTIEI